MIFVFKTSVKTRLQVQQLQPHIDTLVPNAVWNFDLQDCDKILRIDSEENIVLTIIHLMKMNNFYCEELE